MIPNALELLEKTNKIQSTIIEPEIAKMMRELHAYVANMLETRSEKGFFNSSTDATSKKFRRETDTMPQWAGSSWYFMRYIDPKNSTQISSKELLAKWLPVDWYNGGMEHTTLHLLYSRFWYKFMFDIGLVPTNEPYYKRTSQGMILGEGGVKMSKSLGNVVNPACFTQ